ncbi:MAG: pirin family protein [Candidatus Gracilibacteria bacterium]
MNKYIIKNEHRKHWVGDGFLVHNLIPRYSQEIGIHSSPFLMFDYESPTYTPPQKTNHLLEQPRKRGVGQHPHKGFETVTIVYSGSVEHKDSGGNGGIIGPGNVQWMTAGRGIIHQEYLETTFNKTGGYLEFAQIWVNLPKDQKEISPGYQSITSKDIPTIKINDSTIMQLMAGEYLGKIGPAKAQSPIFMANLSFDENSNHKSTPLDIPLTYKLYILVRNGKLTVDNFQVSTGDFLESVELNEVITMQSEGKSEILIFAGEPIQEPVYHYGPFVMDSEEGLERALREYQNGEFGNI